MQSVAQTKAASWPRPGEAGSSDRDPGDLLSRAVAWWHVLLGAIALTNVTIWCMAAAAVARGQATLPTVAVAASQLQLLLSALYVLGCAFRSVLPVYDVPRIVLVDSRLSTVMVGRSVATIAEMGFAAQWALFLYRTAVQTHSPLVYAMAWAIVPMITLAEICSWHSVLTTQQRGHAAENSLWGLSAVLVVASLLVIGPDRLPYLYWFMISWSVGAAAYAAFIFFFDVPMYMARWRADQKNGRSFLTIAQGIADASEQRFVSYRWDDWKGEVVWMSLYFSFGVWSSISLIYATLTLGGHTQ